MALCQSSQTYDIDSVFEKPAAALILDKVMTAVTRTASLLWHLTVFAADSLLLFHNKE